MNISGMGGSPPVKLDLDKTVASNQRPENQLVDRAVRQPDGEDQRIENQIAVSKQQVGGNAESSSSSENQAPRKPRVAGDLSYALTQLGIRGQSSGSNPDSAESEGDANRQSRAASVQPLDPRELNKPERIQF